MKTIQYTLCILALFLATVAHAKDKQVVVYTAMDQIFAEPILKEFEQQTGITVKAVYDIEAVKTTGLVNRLLAEKKHPQCDVFWNNEIMRTIKLQREGVLAPYASPSADDIPAQFQDPDHYWAGFAARARVLVVNTNILQPDQYPTSIHDLVDTKWKGKPVMANPMFGTTSTHVATLFDMWGAAPAEQFLQDLIANEVRIVDGNSVVRDMVAEGTAPWGITDTDDVNVGVLNGKPIKPILPDQDGSGTLLIPNTIAMIKGAPHAVEAKQLIDYMLSREVESKLCSSESAQIPLRPGITVPKGQFRQEDIKAAQVDFGRTTDMMEESVQAVQKLFMR
ncbi:extracellular solute-binding protein [Desulfogranum japonicum]|uniref:extracellular solute-binding protein n=1 Tax=Desulfogranum japonicum TaxID=231447 RepID=UPI0004041AD9|nr:extracellular solute-binding protein [Desulfogranum japonicum]